MEKIVLDNIHRPARDDVLAAKEISESVIIRTPLLRAPTLTEATGAANVFLKVEAFQVTGSFKFRAAYYRMSALSARQKRRGVVAYSSGNFARALAAAGKLLDVPVTLVIPYDAPDFKKKSLSTYDVKIIYSEHGSAPREQFANDLAKDLARKHSLTLLHPFDDPLLIAGHATIAYEALAQLNEEEAAKLDYAICPAGGGGLVAGIALGLSHHDCRAQVIAVEPEGFDCLSRSLERGGPVAVAGTSFTLCDALQATTPGSTPYALAKALDIECVTVREADIHAAVNFSMHDLKLVLEPSGAAGIGWMLQSAGRLRQANVLAFLTGGNADLSSFMMS